MKLTRIVSLLLIVALLPLDALALRNTGEDVLNVGKPGSSANKELRLGSGKFIYEPGVNKLKFTNDGTIFKEVGSGSGSGSGIVLNGNGGAEDGLDQWTFSPGTAAISNSDQAFGVNSIVFAPTAAGQYLRGQGVVVPKGLGGKACTLSWYYTGGSANVVARVWNGISAIATSPAMGNLTGAWSAKKIFAFTCPDAGTIMYPEFYSLGADSIKIDEVKLGQELIQNPSPQGAARFGAAKVGCSGGNFSTSASTMADFTAQTGCVTTLDSGSKGIAALSSGLPGIAFTPDDVTAKYVFVFTGSFAERSNAPGTKSPKFQAFDGTNYGFEEPMTENYNNNSQGVWVSVPHIIQSFTFSDLSTKQIRLRATAGTGTAYVSASTSSPLTVTVYKYPTQLNIDSSQGISIEQSGWRIDAEMGGGNPGLDNSAGALTGLTSSTFDLVLAPGSAPANIACAGTTDSTGLTCSGADESAGISFLPPSAGAYEACVGMSHNANVNNGGVVQAVFTIAETQNASQTVLAEGTSHMNSGFNPGAGSAVVHPVRVCSTFVFNDTSRRTLRAMYRQTASNVAFTQILADRTLGRTISFSVRRKIEFAEVVKVLPANIVPTIQSFTTAGANSWTVPAGVYKVLVYAIGSGGGGGTASGGVGGQGGGAGGIAVKSLTVSPGQVINYTIGAAGVAGGAGNATTFNGTIIGNGGVAGTTGGGQVASNGGTAVGGDLNLTGGPGGTGSVNGAANYTGGVGGSNMFGGGGGAVFAAAGTAATGGYGGGGGGGGTNQSGGAGAPGAIILMY